PLASAVEDHVRDRKPDDLVFAYSDGSPIRHTAFYRDEFKPAVRQAGLDPKLRFHDLRHTCAAMMISLGAHPKAIMERLGHSTITVTLNTYGHLLPELETALIAGMEELWMSAEPAGAGSR
ncbi:MAG: tyrosine-type recombinase/integrase, partial [Acidimicrobiales bacterium]